MGRASGIGSATTGAPAASPYEPSRLLLAVAGRIAGEGGRRGLPTLPAPLARDVKVHLLAWWAGWAADDVRPTAGALEGYVKALCEYRDAGADARVPLAQMDPLGKRLIESRDAAWKQLGPVVRSGLVAREGTFLVPFAVPRVDLLDDWFAWHYVAMWLRVLGAKGPIRGLRVCAGCTAVFKPLRKSTARFCRLCEHSAPAPALGSLESDVLCLKGDRATVRVPRLVGRHAVAGWRRVTLGLCTECGRPFGGRSDRATCSSACRMRRHRRVGESG